MPIITVRSRILLAVAWGPRRVTSSARYGQASAYPPCVTAHHSLWWMWTKQGIKDWFLRRWTIVIPPSKATARIMAQIPKPAPIPDIQTLEEPEISEMLALRAKLRFEKRFKEADEIREKLTAARVMVADAPVKKETQDERRMHDDTCFIFGTRLFSRRLRLDFRCILWGADK